MIRRATAVLLTLLLAVPSADVIAAGNGTIEGSVTIADRPLRGATLAFIDLSSGAVHRASSDATGHFNASVPAGQYAVTTESGAGLVVSQAPAAIVVGGGRTVVADIGLLAMPGAMTQDPAPQAQVPPALPNEPAAPVTATTILHDPIGCMLAGQFPLVNARIEPAASVARARVYFRSSQSPNLYYVEMMPAEGGGFSGKLPRPKLEASPVTYYIQATTTEFGDAQIGEISSSVVNEAEECEDDKAVAPIGPPGEVTVFSAATGASIAPAGFAVGGLALTLGTIALLIGGAAALGITAAITVFNPEPEPSPTPPTPPTAPPPPPRAPTPSPSPSPVPTPIPATPFR